ncbi:hypothetical protein [Chitinophaga sancti]|nr:hypothetical protein [Chitinophaga sancti]WQD63737.1 hypothetical protein U0033_04960 [Chitinophaga sancti]WQG90638.1 hypothetical protein SR876_03960 [Chitinophaga sancti]
MNFLWKWSGEVMEVLSDGQYRFWGGGKKVFGEGVSDGQYGGL